MSRDEYQAGAIAEYGLDPPRYVISLQRGDTTVLAASFGARNPQNVLQYVRVAGRDELYLLPVFVGHEWEQVAQGVRPEVTRHGADARARLTPPMWTAAIGIVVSGLT